MNGYVIVTEADEYFFTRPGSSNWINLDEISKSRALIHATRKIDTLIFKGVKTNPNSINQFPRNGDTVVPEQIKWACMEEAFAIISDNDENRRKLMQQGVTSFSIGDLSESYDVSTKSIFLSYEARQYLKPFEGGAFSAI